MNPIQTKATKQSNIVVQEDKDYKKEKMLAVFKLFIDIDEGECVWYKNRIGFVRAIQPYRHKCCVIWSPFDSEGNVLDAYYTILPDDFPKLKKQKYNGRIRTMA